MISFVNNNLEAPFVKFRELYSIASNAKQNAIQAMCVSSFDAENIEVNARFVNLKFLDNDKLIFFTNYNSPKALQFEIHSQVSLTLYWDAINTQIRIKANLSKTSTSFNKNYFSSRSKNKNALAISSKQSNRISSFEEVLKNYNHVKENNDLSVCPDYWGGYECKPYYFEFWEGHKSRLNKRKVYEYNNIDTWKGFLLEP
tara:strand:+ start:339 stop:938 length:600 start_codon:yes stop_codon:yes gene_type:complete